MSSKSVLWAGGRGRVWRFGPSWGSTTVRRWSIDIERWYGREQDGIPERFRYNFLDGIAGRSNGLVGGWSSEVRVPFGVELTGVGCSRFGRRDGVGEELASLLVKLSLKN